MFAFSIPFGEAFDVRCSRFLPFGEALEVRRSMFDVRVFFFRSARSDRANYSMNDPKYDLEERLLEYSASIVRLVEQLSNTRAGNHVAGQLLRSGTSALPNHGEAQAAESPADFIHKMKICLKELRESYRWLLLVRRVPLITADADVTHLINETDELIRIFVKSIQTAQR